MVWPCMAVDTEDWAAGERLLMDARTQLSRDAAGPSCRVALLDTNNLLGVLWSGLADIATAHHVMGCHLTQQTRVWNAFRWHGAQWA